MSSLPEPPDAATVRCPTCRAAQPWSDTCRRCQSDLRLLRAVAGAYRRSRRACLRHLRDGHPRAAWRAARHAHALVPSAEARRLLAVSALRAGDWTRAAELARRPAPDA